MFLNRHDYLGWELDPAMLPTACARLSGTCLSVSHDVHRHAHSPAQGWRTALPSSPAAHSRAPAPEASKGAGVQVTGASFQALLGRLSSTCRNARISPPFTLTKCVPQTFTASPRSLLDGRLQTHQMAFCIHPNKIPGDSCIGYSLRSPVLSYLIPILL